MRVVFDTNIFVSTFVFPGGAAELAVDRVLEGRDRLFLSLPLILELSRVLSEKFDFSREKILEIARILDDVSVRVHPKLKLAVLGDEPDNRVLECAVAAKADIIVTGDKAMLLLKAFSGIRIIRLKEYLAV